MKKMLLLPHVLAWASLVYSDQYTEEQILSRLEARQAVLHNVHSETLWIERTSQQAVAWDRSTIDMDQPGRIRYETVAGKFNDEGARVIDRHEVKLYDLADTINYDLRYDPELGSGKGEKLHAMVYDRPDPEPNGPHFLRDPLRFLDRTVIHAIKNSRAAGRSVEVSTIQRDGLELAEIKYLRSPDPTQNSPRWTALVDVQRGIVLEEKGQLPNGVIRKVTTINYEANEADIWLPKTGSWKTLNNAGEEIQAWEFTCERIVVNDPDFDERLFELRVPEGAYVYYVPLSIGFRAEDELMGRAAVQEVAEHVLLEAKNELKPVAETSKPVPQIPLEQLGPNQSRNWLLLGNIALLVLMIILLWHKGRRHPQ